MAYREYYPDYYYRPATFIDQNGYERFCDSGKSVHRWAAEKKLKRKLRPYEVVHHIDRDKTNNSLNNLHVFPNQRAHSNAHKRDAYRYGWDYSYYGKSGNSRRDYWY